MYLFWAEEIERFYIERPIWLCPSISSLASEVMNIKSRPFLPHHYYTFFTLWMLHTYLVNICPKVLEKKIQTEGARRMTHGDWRKPKAMGHRSKSDDLIKSGRDIQCGSYSYHLQTLIIAFEWGEHVSYWIQTIFFSQSRTSLVERL